MKIEELIKELNKYDQNATVKIKITPKNIHSIVCIANIQCVKQRGSVVIEGE